MARTFWIRCWGVALAASALMIAGEARKPTSQVEIVVRDTFGAQIRSFQLQLKRQDDDSFRKVIREPGTVELPPGDYVIEGSASLFRNVERHFSVPASRLVLVAFAPVHWGESTVIYPEVEGRLVNPAPHRGDWVRVVAIFGEFAAQARVAEDGSFSIPDVPYGEYFAVIVRGQEILATQRFRTTVRDSGFVIDSAGT